MAWKPNMGNSGHYIGGSPFTFKELGDLDEAEFRQYARDNDPPDLEHWSVYHPVCREEWERRGIKP